MAEFRLERFNSDNVEKYGEEFVKTTLSKELQKLATSAEAEQEKKEVKAEEEQEKKDADVVEKGDAEAKKKKEKKKKNQNTKSEKNKKQRKKAMRGDAKTIAISVGKQLDADIDNYQNVVSEEYTKFEEQIMNTCRQRGEQLGKNDVEKYNKVIRAAAKKTYEVKEKTIKQAEIKAKALVQKAKLKLGAMLGL